MTQKETKPQSKRVEISIENQSLKFQEFLSLPDNERVLFSGIFESGKTYFLNKFFKNNDKYFGIHLYPTNYAVSSNEDIFEYIKFDILYELILKYGPQLEILKVDELDA